MPRKIISPLRSYRHAYVAAILFTGLAILMTWPLVRQLDRAVISWKGDNFSILVSFILSGLGIFLWVPRLTGNTAASIIAGSIFVFALYRMSHLLGHQAIHR